MYNEAQDKLLRRNVENYEAKEKSKEKDVNEVIDRISFAQTAKTYMFNDDLTNEHNLANNFSNPTIDNADFNNTYIKKSSDVCEEIPKEYVTETIKYINNLNLKDKEIKGAKDRISQDKYDEKLEILMNRAKTTLVFKGIPKETFNIVQARLLQSKSINKLDPIKVRESKICKSILNHIFTAKLKIDHVRYV